MGQIRKARGWVGVLVVVSCWSVMPVALAQERGSERVLQVTGQGIITLPAQLAEVEVGVEIRGNNANQVQMEIAQRLDKIISTLRQKSAEKLTTTGVQLFPIYGERQQVLGFIGRNTVRFRLPIPQTGAVLDELVRLGANQINRLSFVASESAIEQGRMQALQAAVQDAQKQAQTVLQTLQLTPKEVVGITILGSSTPMPRSFELAEVRASTPIVGGDQTVQAQVRLEIRY
ncbi:SIMPL domain-containing protein [Gloeomargaritales cyanobacterium VI4D9]|nr:SIMPL domain-containing protein [Gloeomargaritales cyanobacterium VI4D9]